MGYWPCKVCYFRWSVENQTTSMCICFEYYFVDLTENSVEVCKQRYYERRNRCSYEAEFFPLDCTKVRLEFSFNHLYLYKLYILGISS